MAQPLFRKIHRTIAPIFFLPLFISGVTGIIYRIGKDWLGLEQSQTALFLRLHQGSYLGDPLKPAYVLLVGLGAISLIITGFNLLLKQTKNKTFNIRNSHRQIGAILFIPFLVTAVTGSIFRISTTWLQIPYDRVAFLINLHQGEFSGKFLHPIYVLLLGTGLIFMLVTGINMTNIFRQKAKKKGNNENDRGN
jgi:uncharacterized iron-regulated membrane protein